MLFCSFKDEGRGLDIMKPKTQRSKNGVSNVPRMPSPQPDKIGQVLTEDEFKEMKKSMKKERRTKAREQGDKAARRAQLCDDQEFRCHRCDAAVPANSSEFPLYRSKFAVKKCPSCSALHVLSYCLDMIAAKWPAGQVRAANVMIYASLSHRNLALRRGADSHDA